MKVKKFLHTRMQVSDMPQTLAFYQNVLGIQVVEEKISPPGSQLAFLSVPNNEELIELCCFPSSGTVKVAEDLIHFAFEVEDMDKTLEDLQVKNIPITDGPMTTISGERFLFIDPPDGYEIELIQQPTNSPQHA